MGRWHRVVFPNRRVTTVRHFFGHVLNWGLRCLWLNCPSLQTAWNCLAIDHGARVPSGVDVFVEKQLIRVSFARRSDGYDCGGSVVAQNLSVHRSPRNSRCTSSSDGDCAAAQAALERATRTLEAW